MNTDLHPLAVPFPPLQRVGLFAAASVRALVEYSHLNAAALECVTEMAVCDRALPRALDSDMARDDADHIDGVVHAALSCTWLSSPVLAHASVRSTATRALLLHAFHDVARLPRDWSVTRPLRLWTGVSARDFRGPLPDGGIRVDLIMVNVAGYSPMHGAVDLSVLPSRVQILALDDNTFSGGLDGSSTLLLPRRMTCLQLRAASRARST
jgi:hypothetical protein